MVLKAMGGQWSDQAEMLREGVNWWWNPVLMVETVVKWRLVLERGESPVKVLGKPCLYLTICLNLLQIHI